MMIASSALSARYYRVRTEIRELEAEQAVWIELNRGLLANIAIARSRFRVDEAMSKAEGYRMVGPETTVRIRIKPGAEKRDG